MALAAPPPLPLLPPTLALQELAGCLPRQRAHTWTRAQEGLPQFPLLYAQQTDLPSSVLPFQSLGTAEYLPLPEPFLPPLLPLLPFCCCDCCCCC